MRPDGTQVVRLTHTPAGKESVFPDWSPDGRRLVFERGRGGNIQLLVMDRDGHHVRAITRDGQFNGDPAFAPDGSRIVFEHSPRSGCCSNIYSIRLDGSRLRKLTHFARETSAAEPEYSPDGSRIVFTRFPPGGARSAIYVMRAGGGDLRRVTPQRLDAGHPSWSPDGRRIVFNDRFSQPVGDIFTIRPDGRGLRRLTSVAAGGQAGFRPDYSPDGTRIVFDHSGAGGTLQLWVMRADGSAQHPLATGLVDPVGPRWGPRLG